MTVAESTASAPDISFASNFAASGSTFTAGAAIAVPDGSAIVIVAGNNSFSASDISNMVISDSGSHTWDILTPAYDDVNMPFVVAYWKNTTGASVNITPTMTSTYTNNRTLGYSVHLISGDNGSPVVRATINTGINNTGAISASAVPTTINSLFLLHYVHQEASANASGLVTGTIADTSPASTGQLGTGSNGMGLGTLIQSAPNTQTTTAVTLGAAAPTDGFPFAVLVEYRPAGGSGPVGSNVFAARGTWVGFDTSLAKGGSWL